MRSGYVFRPYFNGQLITLTSLNPLFYALIKSDAFINAQGMSSDSSLIFSFCKAVTYKAQIFQIMYKKS